MSYADIIDDMLPVKELQVFIPLTVQNPLNGVLRNVFSFWPQYEEKVCTTIQEKGLTSSRSTIMFLQS